MIDFLFAIESTVLKHRKNYPRLVDKDVEWSYNKLSNYFNILSTNKEIDEPIASTEVKQILLDELLNLIDDREEEGFDDNVVNNPTAP